MKYNGSISNNHIAGRLLASVPLKSIGLISIQIANQYAKRDQVLNVIRDFLFNKGQINARSLSLYCQFRFLSL